MNHTRRCYRLSAIIGDLIEIENLVIRIVCYELRMYEIEYS